MKPFLLLFIFCASLFADAHILCYHRFDDPKPKYKHTNISSKKFSQQIESLKSEGYKFASLSSVVTSLKNKKPIGDKVIVITIDDAYKSFYDYAFPILKAQKIPFTLFAYTDAINNKYKDYMNWEQIKEASKYGDIQLHSHAHKDLTKLTADELKKDTAEGIASFEKNMGYKPKLYAIPFGIYNLAVKNSLKASGFEAIMTVDAGAVNGASDIYQLERIAIDEGTDFKLALGVKPLDITLQKPVGDLEKIIKGAVQNYSGKTIKMYVAKGDVRTLELKNGTFEAKIDMAKVNSKQKLIFYSEGHRYRAKLIEKD